MVKTRWVSIVVGMDEKPEAPAKIGPLRQFPASLHTDRNEARCAKDGFSMSTHAAGVLSSKSRYSVKEFT